ncbi:ACT domain-containing protein [Rhizobium mayense]|uniref:ACT domain-containing protein n=1 Tax=Rhizobium mayense TaxID=1312184 RepID=A0ABT7JYQ9_9HYPH|nr:ACT domain-containing protein [Rhizobium mayense]MDL2401396.1 ACT domain-containing protein [Rhizobium mayense]
MFEETSIVLSVAEPESESDVGILAVSSFNGNYVLVRSRDAAAAVNLLAGAGHRVEYSKRPSQSNRAR